MQFDGEGAAPCTRGGGQKGWVASNAVNTFPSFDATGIAYGTAGAHRARLAELVDLQAP